VCVFYAFLGHARLAIVATCNYSFPYPFACKLQIVSIQLDFGTNTLGRVSLGLLEVNDIYLQGRN
jgi:hypothetical protein